jgi:hypothetical protein
MPRVNAATIAILTVAVGCVDRLPDQDLRIIGATPVAKLSADLLWKEFQADPDKARRAYFGKVVEITGTVTRVAPDGPSAHSLLFVQSGDRGVRASLLDEQAPEILARAKDDPRLTLKCFCEGMSEDLQLKSCVRGGQN